MNEEYQPVLNRGKAVMREIYEWIESGVAAMICVVIVYLFVARLVGVSGESMLPTLDNNDWLVTSSLFYTPSYGDIVVIAWQDNSTPYVKRVIATPGQTVDIDFESGAVTVDGQVLEEDYIRELTHTQYDIEFPQQVPPGHVFVLGDNRNHSLDSRSSEVGMVDQRYIFGRVVYRLLPVDSIGVPH